MKNKKGFTLIELLAVIVILAVIALIATPLVMNVINDAKRSSIRDSAYGILKSAETYFAQMQIKNDQYKGEIFDIKSDTKLDFKGTRYPGKVMVNGKGDTAIAINEDGYCYYKGVHESEVHMTNKISKCDLDMANNMVKNGYGEYGDNTNFESFNYENNKFTQTSDSYIKLTSDEFIKIDPNKTYEISATMKTNNPDATFYIGVIEYDIDKKIIYSHNVKYINDTLTTLKQDLNNGDTTIYLNDNQKWVTEQKEGLNRGIIFWNYKDSMGYLYGPETYSQYLYQFLYELDNINKNDNIITLKKPWDHGKIEAGTKLSQSFSGNQHNYGLVLGKLSNTFTVYKNMIHGVQINNGKLSGAFDDTKFRPGTQYIKLVVLHNYRNNPNTNIEIKDIVVKEVER